MTGRTIGFVLAGGIFMAVATLAVAQPAMALETFRSYSAGCARWEGQGAGQRMKCFNCLKRQRIGGRSLWVNTCPRG